MEIQAWWRDKHEIGGNQKGREVIGYRLGLKINLHDACDKDALDGSPRGFYATPGDALPSSLTRRARLLMCLPTELVRRVMKGPPCTEFWPPPPPLGTLGASTYASLPCVALLMSARLLCRRARLAAGKGPPPHEYRVSVRRQVGEGGERCPPAMDHGPGPGFRAFGTGTPPETRSVSKPGSVMGLVEYRVYRVNMTPAWFLPLTPNLG